MNDPKRFRPVLLFVILFAASSTAPFAKDAHANPLKGYNIHVTAPHIMDGEVIGPFHHFCKPINSDIIQCVLFESTDENARMTEIEYMVSKKLARSVIPKWSHRKNWHDHKQEIETGRVAILNPTDPDEQKKLAEYVSDTDGIIFHLWPHDAPIPDGSVSIAQSIGHWEAIHGKLDETAQGSGSGAAEESGIFSNILKKLGIQEVTGAFK